MEFSSLDEWVSGAAQLTILATDNSPGLQLFLDNQWCDVPPMSDAFVINLGDLLERCVCS